MRAARAALWISALACVAGAAAAEAERTIDPRAWRIVPSESGPTNYYSVELESGATHVRARYRPPMKSAVLGWQAPEDDRAGAKKLRWTWRALVLPQGGDECVRERNDSAADVYVMWKRGLRYYTIKYVWSATGKKGAVCDRKRNPFLAQDTVILESGGPTGVWRAVEVDLRAAFRNHFADGDSNAAVADFVGLGLMTDGDQTGSESSADYGPFTLVR